MTITALAVLVLLVLLVARTGVRLVRQDRSTTPPASHHDWASGSVPSRPYSAWR